MRIIYLICVLIILCTVSIFIYKYSDLQSSKTHTPTINTIKPHNIFPIINTTIETYTSNNTSELLIYTTSSCGMCKKLKQKLPHIKNKIMHDYPNVQITEIDCSTNLDKCVINKNGKSIVIDGVPTLVLRNKTKNDIEYTGYNTESGILGFLSQNL